MKSDNDLAHVNKPVASSLRNGYRRAAYRLMAERLGFEAVAAYDRVFATEPKPPG